MARDGVDAGRPSTSGAGTTRRAADRDDRGGGARANHARRTAMKRTGRHALSLDRFVNARKSTYDKRERIKRDKAEAAATRAKYARLQKKLAGTFERREEFDPEVYERRLAMIDNPELAKGDGERGDVGREDEVERETETTSAGGDALTTTRDDNDDERPEEQRNSKGKKKKFDHLAAAWKNGQAARDEREAQRKAFVEQKAARDAARRDQLAKRSSQKQLMRKKTKRGQPVMKHRVQNILDKLHAEAAASGGLSSK
jgi:hypothetical protein